MSYHASIHILAKYGHIILEDKYPRVFHKLNRQGLDHFVSLIQRNVNPGQRYQNMLNTNFIELDRAVNCEFIIPEVRSNLKNDIRTYMNSVINSDELVKSEYQFVKHPEQFPVIIWEDYKQVEYPHFKYNEDEIVSHNEVMTCKTCGKKFNSENIRIHLLSKRHVKSIKY